MERAAVAFSVGLGDPLVNSGWESQEEAGLTSPAAGSGPSLGLLGAGQWLLHLLEGREDSTVLQNLLGAEYAETTDRSEEDSRRPVSTSVSWAPSKSSTDRRWPGLHSEALCLWEPVRRGCGSAGEGPPLGKQNKDLLLWKDRAWLEVLDCGVHSCLFLGGRVTWLGPRKGLLCRAVLLLSCAVLGVSMVVDGVERGFFSEWCARLHLGTFLCVFCACGERDSLLRGYTGAHC